MNNAFLQMLRVILILQADRKAHCEHIPNFDSVIKRTGDKRVLR